MNDMERNIKTYNDLLGHPEYTTVVSLSDVFLMCLRDGVTKLHVSENDYDLIRRWMIAGFQWNWDGKSFMGIEFVIDK